MRSAGKPIGKRALQRRREAIMAFAFLGLLALLTLLDCRSTPSSHRTPAAGAPAAGAPAAGNSASPERMGLGAPVTIAPCPAVVDAGFAALDGGYVVHDGGGAGHDGGYTILDGGYIVGPQPALAIDPNNCGVCGTICGTYAPMPNQPGAAFVQGTCAHSVCAPSTVSQHTGSPAGHPLDCWDLGPAGAVIGGPAVATPFTLPPSGCVSLLTSTQNCGGLGWTCSGGTCLSGRCNGALHVPAPLVLHGTSPTAAPEALSATGGVPPYAFAFADNGGNQSGGTLSLAGAYVPGPVTGVTDVVVVFDSVGNEAVFLISVT